MSISDAFTKWVNRSKEILKDKFSTKRLEERHVKAILDDVFAETRRGFIKDMGPAVYKAYLDGSIEAGFGMDQKAIKNFAYNYAAQVADYANAMSSEAAAEAYIGALKRKQPPPKAFEFMQKAFGSDRRAVRSLLVQLENEEGKDLTVGERSSQKQKNMDAYVAATIQRRAKLFGDEESFASKQMSKALVWNLAAKQGYLPPGTMKEWYTVRDERTCKTCGPMHRQQVNVTERFRTKEGKLLWGPQVHPNCRCQVRLVVVGTTKEKPQAPLTASQFARGKVSKMWSQNNWETQPRSPSGRFGERPGSKQKGMYSGTSLYAPKGSPIQPKQRQRVAVLERPADLRAQQMEQELEARAKQDIGTKSIEDTLKQLEAMPQVSAFDMIEDSDVLALTQPKVNASTRVAVAAEAYARAGSTAANPVVMAETRAAPIPKLNHVAVSASPELQALVASQPKVAVTTRVDVAATMLANAKPEEKADVRAAIEADGGVTHDLDKPAYAALPAHMGNTLLGGMTFHEEGDEVSSEFIDFWRQHAEDVALKYASEVGSVFDLSEEEITAMFVHEAEKMALEELANRGIAVDDTSWADTVEFGNESNLLDMQAGIPTNEWNRARRVIDFQAELEQGKPMLAEINRQNTEWVDDLGNGSYTINRDTKFVIDANDGEVTMEWYDEYEAMGQSEEEGDYYGNDEVDRWSE